MYTYLNVSMYICTCIYIYMYIWPTTNTNFITQISGRAVPYADLQVLYHAIVWQAVPYAGLQVLYHAMAWPSCASCSFASTLPRNCLAKLCLMQFCQYFTTQLSSQAVPHAVLPVLYHAIIWPSSVTLQVCQHFPHERRTGMLC